VFLATSQSLLSSPRFLRPLRSELKSHSSIDRRAATVGTCRPACCRARSPDGTCSINSAASGATALIGEHGSFGVDSGLAALPPKSEMLC
jgi:hypothetical protein